MSKLRIETFGSEDQFHLFVIYLYCSVCVCLSISVSLSVYTCEEVLGVL